MECAVMPELVEAIKTAAWIIFAGLIISRCV